MLLITKNILSYLLRIKNQVLRRKPAPHKGAEKMRVCPKIMNCTGKTNSFNLFCLR